jgi:hypothetical protein
LVTLTLIGLIYCKHCNNDSPDCKFLKDF